MPLSRYVLSLLAAVALLTAGCDAVEPQAEERLVVEAFVEARKPLSAVTLRRTTLLTAPERAAPAQGAELFLTLDGQRVPYAPDPAQPGRYVPAAEEPVPARTPFTLVARWQGQEATAASRVPPPIAIDSVAITVPEEPVEAVLLDSLRLDSLGTGAEEGFIYPVAVSLWWTTDFVEAGPDSLYWIRTHLRPFTVFSSKVVDFFLRPEEIFRERTRPEDAQSRRRWQGLYAVPVGAKDEPLPAHRLTVALVRGGPDYARFAATLGDPDRREPVSNVEGGLGIAAGIALDSVQVRVE